MTETAYVRRTVPASALTNIYAAGGDITNIENARLAEQLMRKAAKCGMFWSSHGVPTWDGTTVAAAGSLCLDTSNKDLYVADAGAWNKLTTA